MSSQKFRRYELYRVFDKLANVTARPGRLSAAAEVAQALQNGDAALALLSDSANVGVQLILICRRSALHNLNACRRVIADRGKRLGKFMRQRRHHLPERGQP